MSNRFIFLMLSFVFSFSINAKEMVIQTTTSYILEKFTYSNESTYSIYKGEGSWTNDLGDYGHIKCMGPIEKNENYFKLNHICEYINQNNEKMWHRVNREGNQDADAGVGKSTIFDATGKYKKYIVSDCAYAIKYLDNKNFSKSKCKLN
ncbi:hypothetical protein N9V56_04180 [Alphaproteobacteria bacterium]|nr:hypothetical protein [Alphaproteobacteria bacterium]